MSDLKARYDKLLAAVEVIECGAQSYTIDGQSVTKANLATLYRRIQMLESQIRQENGENLSVVDFADRG